jgi:hypothetical protein
MSVFPTKIPTDHMQIKCNNITLTRLSRRDIFKVQRLLRYDANIIYFKVQQ